MNGSQLIADPIINRKFLCHKKEETLDSLPMIVRSGINAFNPMGEAQPREKT